jgi:hypothetical protein
MTDRFKGFIVVLDRDVREDDAEAIVTALKMVKGVKAVTPVETAADDYIVAHRVKSEIERSLWEWIDQTFRTK